MKTKKIDIIYFLSALAYFQPARYAIGNTLYKVWNVYILIVSCVYIVLFLITRINRRVKKWGTGLLLLFVSFFYCFIFASFLNINTSDFVVAIIYIVTISGFISFICVGLEHNPKSLMRGYLLSGLLMSTIHLYTILKYQNIGGMRTGISSLGRAYSENWFFLAHANASFFIIFPVIIVLFIYAYEYNKKLLKFAYLYLSFTLLCFYIQWSVAGLVGFAILALLLVVDGLQSAKAARITSKLLNLKVVVIVSLVIEMFLAFFSGMSEYTDLLFAIFSKSQSVFARLRIWTRAVQYIEMRPIWGNGWNYEAEAVYRITASHAHNILLEFLYCGGIIGTLLFVLSIFKLQKKLNIFQYDLSKIKGYRILLLSVIPFIVTSTFDFYLYRFHPFIIYILLMNYYLNEKKRRSNLGKAS